MEMVEVLCTGDLHLGRHPTRIPDRLDGPSMSPRSVWQDVVREAIDRKVDAVVLTGDVADRENRYFEAYGAFEAGVIDLDDAGIPVVAVAGNHDSEFLPRMIDDIDVDSLHLLGKGGTWERWTLQKGGAAAVHFDGWSFDRPHISSSPMDGYDLPEAPDVPQVGVLHADLNSPRSEYAPVTSSELKDVPVSGWLLGHIHVPGVRIESDPLTLYPGSPQALDPGEQGVHGPWLVSVSSDKIDAEQLPLGTVCYDEIQVDVTDAEDLQAVGSKISTALQKHVQEDLETRKLAAFLPRVRLTGRTPAHTELVEESQTLVEQLATKQGSVNIQIESITVDTHPDIDLEAVADGEGPVSYLADLLIALENGGSDGQYNQAVDEAHEAMQRAHSASAYDLLRREADVGQPRREDAVKAVEQEARVLLDTLLQQKEDQL
ncbi:metallophosphoesterase family protein [Natranaeroarchaeum sulfidigenes]|uniref:DNA repair exonuclease, SbcD n=1 Tax=Natranaeroarchaeum sulfidigenes TaxID=2784880 RepID=A0A897MVA0_9EURY|nr:DNA repair exonuclease [Natranaeroarchaeum sulfidigenes]QSG02869.1 DNA repair exonuclease, SbcD [Natranaeroarchaeum sulfidigenes]